MKAPLGLDLPRRLSSSYCDDYEGMEEESGRLLSLLGENVEGSFNSSPLLAQWRRVHTTVQWFQCSATSIPLCALRGDRVERGMSLGDAQVSSVQLRQS